MPLWDLIATCAVGLEAVVVRELERLGYAGRITQTGRIVFQGDASAVCRANLWLRSADRVLLRLGNFEATDFGQLFDRTRELPWEEWIPVDGLFPVLGRSVKSQLSSVPACQKIVKKAIVEKLKATHAVAWFEETGAACTVEVALLEDQATLTMDTTGPSLHKRGYRTLVSEAQLKETMASALVQLSFWQPDRPLVDPFCGSGTIPIEAALLGRNMAPGMQRSFNAEAWPLVPHTTWQAAREEARDLARPDLPQRILGTDIDEEVLGLARYHAQQAGVAEQIHFQRRDFRDLTSQREYGCLISNPPYGLRMGRTDEVESLYQAMPLVLRRLPTWSHYILTAHPDFESLVGRPADRRRKLYNGQIECTYYQFFGPKPRGRSAAVEARETTEGTTEGTSGGTSGEDRAAEENRLQPRSDLQATDQVHEDPRTEIDATDGVDEPSPAELLATQRSAMSRGGDAVGAAHARHVAQPRPAFGGLSDKSLEQGELFRRRLTTRARHLRRWPTKRGITCYRLYDRDIPEIPLVVDRYENCLHLVEYDRPHDRSPAEHADWLDLMARVAREVLEVAASDVFFKRRNPHDASMRRTPSGAWAREPRVVEVRENGLRFGIELSDEGDPGLPLDYRLLRAQVREQAAEKRFLSLFGAAGSFTVCAAAGAARGTTTVDASASALAWTKANLQRNDLDGPRHRLVQDDVLGFLRRHERGAHYDLAIVDAPAYSQASSEFEWDLQRDHVEILNRLGGLMSDAGVMLLCARSRRFKLASEEVSPWSAREISRQTVPEDFRSERIHRAWRWSHVSR